MAQQEIEIRFRYDAKNDVFYGSLGEPREAISEEIGDGVFVRRHPETDEIVGLTILDFAKRSSAQHAGFSLPLKAQPIYAAH
jgi:uncharacterized protein YuzE